MPALGRDCQYHVGLAGLLDPALERGQLHVHVSRPGFIIAQGEIARVERRHDTRHDHARALHRVLAVASGEDGVCRSRSLAAHREQNGVAFAHPEVVCQALVHDDVLSVDPLRLLPGRDGPEPVVDPQDIDPRHRGL